MTAEEFERLLAEHYENEVQQEDRHELSALWNEKAIAKLRRSLFSPAAQVAQ